MAEVVQARVGFGIFGVGRTGLGVGGCPRYKLESGCYFTTAKAESRRKQPGMNCNMRFPEGDEGGR